MAVRLEINTNGAWRVVIHNVPREEDEAVKTAARTLGFVSVDERGHGIAWRLFCTRREKVVAYCAAPNYEWNHRSP